MPLSDAIKLSDTKYCMDKVYQNDDPTKSDDDLAQDGKCRLVYQHRKVILDPKKADYSGFSKQRNDAIQDYLKKRVTVMYAYSGVAGNVPDPVTVFTARIKTFTYNLPPYFASPADFVVHINLMLSSAILAEVTNTFVGLFTFRPFSIPSIPAVLDYETNCQVLGNTIENAVRAAINPVPSPTVHGAFTGPAIMTGIVLV